MNLITVKIIALYIVVGLFYACLNMIYCIIFKREEFDSAWKDGPISMIMDILALIVGWPLLIYLDIIDKYSGDK